LPVAEHAAPADFEQLFGTPHGLDLAHAAALAGAKLHRPRTPAELHTITRDCIGRGFHFIHVRTERAANVAHHRALQAAVAAALEGERWP
jgi:2-succinyl-5-enolpyruvyl-6-hydroxy-3-cyclohexene-1-carboxylate synthase